MNFFLKALLDSETWHDSLISFQKPYLTQELALTHDFSSKSFTWTQKPALAHEFSFKHLTELKNPDLTQQFPFPNLT